MLLALKGGIQEKEIIEGFKLLAVLVEGLPKVEEAAKRGNVEDCLEGLGLGGFKFHKELEVTPEASESSTSAEPVFLGLFLMA